MVSAFVDIADFLAQRRIALIGASRDPKHHSRRVLRQLVAAGYDVVPVNTAVAHDDQIDGRPAFAHVGDIVRNAPPVSGAILMMPRNAAAAVVAECAAAEVKRVWLYRAAGSGAATPKAIAATKALELRAVLGECPLIFLPSPSPCAWLRGALHKLAGSWPRRDPTAPRTTTRLMAVLAVLQIIVALPALVLGALVVAEPDAPLGLSMTLLGHAPFETFLVPGLALLVLGLGHLVGAFFTLTRAPNAGAIGVWLGVALALYIIGQWVWLPAQPRWAGAQAACLLWAFGEATFGAVWLARLTPPIAALRALPDASTAATPQPAGP